MEDMRGEAVSWGRRLGMIAAIASAAAGTACGSDGDEGGPGNATGGDTASGGVSSEGGASGGGGSDSGGATGSGATGSGATGSGATGSGATGGATSGGAGGTAAAEGASCMVDGVVYPHGATNVPDAASCNTCQCTDGQLAACTKIACPTSCPRNRDFGTQCAECGPVDDCLVVEHGCFEVCDFDGDCRDGACIEGVCAHLCG